MRPLGYFFVLVDVVLCALLIKVGWMFLVDSFYSARPKPMEQLMPLGMILLGGLLGVRLYGAARGYHWERMLRIACSTVVFGAVVAAEVGNRIEGLPRTFGERVFDIAVLLFFLFNLEGYRRWGQAGRRPTGV